jgi:hypothetical protein
MDTLTGIDLTGEKKPVIIKPGKQVLGANHFAMDGIWI